MELLIMAYALKTSCARNIIGVIPYFPYSKQSKMRKRGSIVCKLLASMLAKAGLTHMITMDLHQKEIQGFSSCPVDNLKASPFLLQYIQEEHPDSRNAVIVAKSPGAAKRAQSYAERLRLGLAVIHGEAQCTEQDMDDGRHSPPMVKNATVRPGLELPSVVTAGDFLRIGSQFKENIPLEAVRGCVAMHVGTALAPPGRHARTHGRGQGWDKAGGTSWPDTFPNPGKADNRKFSKLLSGTQLDRMEKQEESKYHSLVTI
ncbi:phosphoribosyl pyrophosphate synthase-associated protein 1-like [Leptosomus discolor]